MTWIDGLIIVGALIGAVIGFRQGLFLSVFSFLGLVAGVATAGATSDALADKLSSSAAPWACILSFTIILIIVLVLFNILGYIAKQFIKTIMLGLPDSVGGALIGFFVGALFVAAIFIAVGRDLSTSTVGTDIGSSPLAHLLIDTCGLLLLLLPDSFDAVKDLFS